MSAEPLRTCCSAAGEGAVVFRIEGSASFAFGMEVVAIRQSMDC